MKEITIAPIKTEAADVASKEASIMLVEARTLTIKSQEGYDKAGSLLQAIKSRLKSLDTLRKSITKPIDEAKTRVMDLFRTPLSHYEEAETIVKKAVVAYDEEQEKIRKVEEDRLARDAEKKRQEAMAKAEKARAEGKEDKADKYEEKAAGIVAPTIASNATRPNGIQYRDQWKAEVVDFSKLPDAYKLPNMTMLNKHAQNTKGNVLIAGVKFNKEKIVASKSL